MVPVTTIEGAEKAAKKAIEALYGPGIKDFKARVIFPFPSEHKRHSWDAQVTFLLEGTQYTADVMIEESNGQITSARLIDKMTPL